MMVKSAMGSTSARNRLIHKIPVVVLTPLRNRMSSTISKTSVDNDHGDDEPVHIPDTMSPLRKSIASNSMIDDQKDLNDDEAERNERRKSALLIKSAFSVQNNVSDIEEISEKNLTDHFETCLQLFNQNKINSKNAWSLHIIDYMRRVLHGPKVLREILQVASTSLDASAKIYGLRVDDIHGETIKLAKAMADSNINSKSKKQGNLDESHENSDNENMEGSCEEGKEAEKKAVKKKKKINLLIDGYDRNRKTVCKDPAKLNKPVKKFAHAYNDYIAPTNNLQLLTNTLKKKPGYEFMLLVRKQLEKYRWAMISAPMGPSAKVRIKPVVLSKRLPLCSTFDGFIRHGWDPEAEENELRTYDKSCNKMGDENENSFANHEDVYDMEGNVEDHTIDEVTTARAGCFARSGAEVAHITDLRPECNSDGYTLEYAYKSAPNMSDRFIITGAWAGPAHWKVKCLRRDRVQQNADTQPTDKVKRSKTVPQPINCELKTPEEIMKPLVHGKSRLIQRNILDSVDRWLLPENMEINVDDKSRLGLRAKIYIVPLKKSNNAVDLNMSNYEYNNPNDAEYCSQALVEEGWHSDGEAGDNADESQAPPSDNLALTGDNLVAAPKMVPKTFLTYASMPKKVDMKRLKTAMWKGIVNKDVPYTIVEEVENKKGIKPISLSKIYHEELPRTLSKQMNEDLNISMAFAALLHLATEQGLDLKQKSDLSDIVISKKPTE